MSHIRLHLTNSSFSPCIAFTCATLGWLSSMFASGCHTCGHECRDKYSEIRWEMAEKEMFNIKTSKFQPITLVRAIDVSGGAVLAELQIMTNSAGYISFGALKCGDNRGNQVMDLVYHTLSPDDLWALSCRVGTNTLSAAEIKIYQNENPTCTHEKTLYQEDRLRKVAREKYANSLEPVEAVIWTPIKVDAPVTWDPDQTP